MIGHPQKVAGLMQPYPLPREIRASDVLVGDGGTTYGPFTFKIFDIEDVEIWVKPQDGSWTRDTTATVAKTSNLALDTFSITFAAAIPATTQFALYGRRLHERSLAVTKGGTLSTDQLEKELSKQGATLEELRRDVDRSLKLSPGEDPGDAIVVPGDDGTVPLWQGGRLIADGPSADEIAAAQGHAETALAKAAEAVAAATAAIVAASSVQPTLPSRAAATLFTPLSAPVFLQTAGYDAPGDLGGGTYLRDGAHDDLSLEDANGTIFTYELAARAIDIRQLGAKASGSDSDATRNADAIDEALDRTGVAMVYQTPDAFHIGDRTFDLSDDKYIICPSGRGKLKGEHGASGAMVTITGYEQYKGVRGIHFDMEAANATASAIHYDTAPALVFKHAIEDCFFHACGHAVWQPSAAHDIGEGIWKNCKSEYARGTQFYSAASNGFLFLKNVNVDLTKAHTGQYAHDWTAIQIERFIGLSLDEVAVTGQGFAHLAGTVYNANAKGIIIDGVDSATRRYVWMPGFVRVEAAQGDSIHVKRSVFDKGVGSVESFAGLGTGVYYYQMSFVQQAQMLARGANDYIGAPAGADAFVFEECTDSIITALVAGSATGHGVKVKNCARMTFVAPLTTGNTGYGIESEGTSDAITIIEHQSISDGAPSLLVGPNSVIRGQTVDGVRRINDYNAVTVYNGSGASPSTSFAKLPLNTVLAGNHAGKWDTTNSQITNLVGPARFAGQVYFSAGAVDQQPLEVALYRDGALYQHAWTIASGTGGHMVPFSFTVPSVAANVWDLRVKSATAGTIPTNASYTFMTVDLL